MVVSEHRDGVTIAVSVQPRASATAIRDVRDDAIRLAVAAPPVDGAANKAVIQFFSKRLKVRRGDVEILSGERSRNKVVLVRGTTVADVVRALDLPAAPPDQ